MITTTGALVGHWMNTLAEHVSLPLVSCGVRVNQSIVLCAVLCEPLFVFCFRFFYSIVSPSSIFRFWLPS
jgi:hypothetical protein